MKIRWKKVQVSRYFYPCSWSHQSIPSLTLQANRRNHKSNWKESSRSSCSSQICRRVNNLDIISNTCHIADDDDDVVIIAEDSIGIKATKIGSGFKISGI
jgi:hypothetical protein